MQLRIFLALLLSAAIPLPAFAQPHVIAQLGTAPLIGQISSTPQLQTDVTRQRRIFETAAGELGLSPSEYARFESQIEEKRLTYVTLPRHLDAMSWSNGRSVYVLHDVVIPANTKGWEIDLQEGRNIVALFIPARCGNLSVVRKTLPALALTKPRPAMVEAAATAPPASVPAPVIAMPAAAAATPAPYQSIAATTGPAHHFSWWPLLLIPVAALFFHGSNGVPVTTSPARTSAPPTVVAPTPQPVAGCTPAPH